MDFVRRDVPVLDREATVVLHGSGWKSTLDGAGESHSWGGVSQEALLGSHLRRVPEKLLALPLYTEETRYRNQTLGKLPTAP